MAEAAVKRRPTTKRRRKKKKPEPVEAFRYPTDWLRLPHGMQDMMVQAYRSGNSFKHTHDGTRQIVPDPNMKIYRSGPKAGQRWQDLENDR